MPQLKGTKTHENLKQAFAGESQASRRYTYFAKQADVEGHPDIAGLFRDTAEGETGHAHAHLEYLEAAGDPDTLVTDCPLAAIQIEQGIGDGRKPIHPIQVLKQAYEGTSAKPIEAESAGSSDGL